MKKFLLSVLVFCAVLLPVFGFSGCASSEDLEKYKTENSQLTTENSQLTTENSQLTTENSQLTTENTQLKADKAGLQSQVQDLTEKLLAGVLCYDLVVDETLSLDIKAGDSFLVVISSSSGYLNLNSQKSISLKLQNWASDSFVDYDTLVSGSYLTPGAGIYKVTVTQVQGAQTATANLVLTSTFNSGYWNV